MMTAGATYWDAVRVRAKELKSDGCTKAPDFYLDACYEHDIHYRTHAWLDGVPITRAQADALLRKRIRDCSPLGVVSPMALIWWGAVRTFGSTAWQDDEKGSPFTDWWCGAHGQAA
jgi:hypothetical protein